MATIPPSGTEASEVEAELAAAERAGLRLALIGRTLALLPFAAWYGWFGLQRDTYIGLATVSLFILAGLVHLTLILIRRERPWHRYAFLALDAVALGVLVVVTPLSPGGAGEVPQILLFRAYGVYYLFLFLAVAALSMSPRRTPAASAGLLACTLATSAPEGRSSPSESAMSFDKGCSEAPNHGRRTVFPPFCALATTTRTMAEGMANPMPTEPPLRE